MDTEYKADCWVCETETTADKDLLFTCPKCGEEWREVECRACGEIAMSDKGTGDQYCQDCVHRVSAWID